MTRDKKIWIQCKKDLREDLDREPTEEEIRREFELRVSDGIDEAVEYLKEK